MRAPLALLLLLRAATAWGQGAEPSPCLAAAAQAETEAGVPPGLLAAIGRVESGRWNPASRQTEAWPWTANAAGTGRHFTSRDEALAGVRQARANGYQSIDVGCFQVNLMHHPAAFATLDEALDPLANARYAARFLSTLRAGTGSWEAAVGQYHSANPEHGKPYRNRVLTTWQGGDPAITHPTEVSLPAPTPLLRPMAVPALPARPDPHVLMIRTGFLPGVRTVAPDPHVVSIPATPARRRG